MLITTLKCQIWIIFMFKSTKKYLNDLFIEIVRNTFLNVLCWSQLLKLIGLNIILHILFQFKQNFDVQLCPYLFGVSLSACWLNIS